MTYRTVQSTIRTIIFLLVFLFLGIFTFFPFLGLISAAPEIGGFITVAIGLFDLWLASLVARMFYILPEWERLVLLRLGNFSGVKGPGLFIIPPFIYSVANIVDIRITTQQVEATATLTKDNVPTRVTAAIEFEVENAKKAVISVKDFLSSVIWLSTEALKNTIGGLDLKELLSNREEIAKQLKSQIDAGASDYGVNVRAVRITDIDTPPELVEELAVIARARRAARAKQIQAEAEIEVAKKVAEASRTLAKQKGGFRLREIQNLAAISKEESSMIIVYPFQSSAGEEIAHAAVSLTSQIQKQKRQPASKTASSKRFGG
jgi:regulator of protease activity HflC (stomatin/prohibitin superfamily)